MISFHRSILFAILSTICYCLCAQWAIPVPGSPVPISLQSLFILTFSAFMKPRFSLCAIITYILLGALGLPVFSDGNAGLNILTGKTGGYLLGFIPAAFFMSWSMQKIKTNHFLLIFSSMLLATLIILAFGFIVLGFKIGYLKALEHGIIPFIPGAIIKGIIGSCIVYIVKQNKLSANE